MSNLGPPCVWCGAPRDDHFEYHCVSWEAPKPPSNPAPARSAPAVRPTREEMLRRIEHLEQVVCALREELGNLCEVVRRDLALNQDEMNAAMRRP